MKHNVDSYSSGKAGASLSGGSGAKDPRPMKSSSGDKAMKHSLGFTPGALHGYMGHFMGEDVLRKGHNVARQPVIEDPGFGTPGSRPPSTTFVQNRRGAQVARSIEGQSRRSAVRAIKQGNVEVAAARPVLAERVQAKTAGLTGAALRKDVRAVAKANPESRRNERKTRRSLRNTVAAGVAGLFGA